jgi:dTMP kinase
MTQSGCFITLEGIEGAGKSTLARAIKAWLQQQGRRAVLTREPGGTPLAERVRQLVLEPHQEALPSSAEMLLMFAARSVHLDNLVRPALQRGEWVICDRFTDATRAYQGAGRGVDLVLIEELARCIQGSTTPNCTFLLDLPVADGLARAKSRATSSPQQLDRFESEQVAFFERVRACYLELARREPERFCIIDATAPFATVEQQALARLQRLL